MTSVLAQESAAGEGGGAETAVIDPVSLVMTCALALAAIGALWFTGWFDRTKMRGNRDASGLSGVGWLAVGLAAFVGQAFVGGLAMSGLAAVLEGDLALSMAATIFGAIGAIAVGVAALSTIAPKTPIARPAGLVLRWRDLWVGALVCVAALPLVSVAGMLMHLLVEGIDPLSHETLRLLKENESLWATGLTVAAVVVAAPVGEEFVFRGLLQTGLVRLRVPALVSVGVVSVVFLSIHVTVLDPAMMPALLVLSMVLGLSYERTGRLGTPIVAHACFNAFNLWAAGL